nr:retrovirus-related Pol polyprotein from transposon TNT 1-94 [Tanacetum cinerariifolium]
FNRRKFYSKPTNNNLKTSSTYQSANKKQEFVKTDDKKTIEKKRDMSKVKCYNCKKEGHFAKDCKKAKVKDYNYYKTKILLAKKDSDEQVLLVEDQAWMESSSDSDQEINENMVFMVQMEKVLSESDESSLSAEETIAKVAYCTSESESEYEFETSEYYDNSTNYGLFVNNDDDQEIFHDAIDSQKDYDKSEVDHNDSEEKEHLADKLIQKFNHKIAKCQKRIKKANQQSKDLENQNKGLQEKYDVLITQVNNFEEKNNEFNEQIKVLNEKNADLLDHTKVLKDQLQVKHVVIDTHVECHEKYAKLEEERYEYMIRYSALFDNDKQHRKHIADQEVLFDKMSVKLVELDKLVRDLKNTVLEKDFKIFELEECVCNKDLEIEKCLEHLNVCENKLHKMGQTNQTVHMIMPFKDNLYNGRKGIGFENPSYFEKAKDLRPTLYDEKVIGLGYVNEKINFEDDYFQEIINPDFEKIDSSFQQTSSLKPYVPNVILEKIITDLEDKVVSLLEKEKENLKTIESLKSKGFESSENAISESENQSENDCHVVEKECEQVENPKIVQIYLWIIDSRCSKHMTGNRALLKNFVEKFLGTVRFGNNDFAGYGDVVIGSMTIKKVYYVEGLGHNLFSVGQFYDKGLEVAFQKSTCFLRNEDGVDLLTRDRSSNLYTIALNEVASNFSTCLLVKASSSQSWLWHQRLSHLNFATINNLVKHNLVQGLPKMKFEKDHLCSTCEQGKINRKHHKSKMAFASNKPLYLLHMDLCGLMHVESINGKRYVLVVVNDYSRYTWVFFLHSKDEASEVIISFIKKTQVNL